MSLTNLTLADVKQLEKLLLRKVHLESEIHKINRQIEGLSTGGASKLAARGQSLRLGKPRKRKGTVRGALKLKITTALKKSGPAGIHVQDLAKQIKVKEANVRSWFFTTGKKFKEVKKAGPARYRWDSKQAN